MNTALSPTELPRQIAILGGQIYYFPLSLLKLFALKRKKGIWYNHIFYILPPNCIQLFEY